MIANIFGADFLSTNFRFMRPRDPAEQRRLNRFLFEALSNPEGVYEDRSGMIHTVEGLVAQGAYVDAETKTELLRSAIDKKNLRMLEDLLEREVDGFDINAEEDFVPPLLERAVRSGSVEIAESLLQHGVEVDKVSQLGSTALEEAIEQKNLEMVKTLLRYGAKVNREDRPHQPLIQAARYGNAKILEILLERGADSAKTNRDGKTALSVIHHSKNEDRIRSANILVVHSMLASGSLNFNAMPGGGMMLKYYLQENLNLEAASAILATDRDDEDGLVRSFVGRNPNRNIFKSCIVGVGAEVFRDLKELRDWHVKYLTESEGLEYSDASKRADERFLDQISSPEKMAAAVDRNRGVRSVTSQTIGGVCNDISSVALHREEDPDKTPVDIIRTFSPEEFFRLEKSVKKEGGKVPSLKELAMPEAIKVLAARLNQKEVG